MTNVRKKIKRARKVVVPRKSEVYQPPPEFAHLTPAQWAHYNDMLTFLSVLEVSAYMELHNTRRKLLFQIVANHLKREMKKYEKPSARKIAS